MLDPEDLDGRRVKDEARRAPPEWSTWLLNVRSFRSTYGPEASASEVALRAADARRIAAHRRRWRAQDRITETLYAMREGCWEYARQDRNSNRKTHARLCSVSIGGVQLQIDGRMIRHDWKADPERTANRQSECERTWATRATLGGAITYQPHTCGQATCPVCAYHKAGEDVPELVPILSRYVAAGCTIVHMTSTQRVIVGSGPVVLTDAEAAAGHVRYTVRATVDGGGGTSTGGESLHEAWERLAASLKLSTDGRTGEAWARDVLIEIRGMECTQRDAEGSLRWHVHAHRLIVLAPHVTIETERIDCQGTSIEVVTGGAWWDAAVSRWCEVSDGADPKGQLARVVARPGGDASDLTRALRQVLKYAGDVPTMTAAGIVDFLAAIKGRHTHQRMRDLHGTSGAGAALRACAAWRAHRDKRTPKRRDGAPIDLESIAKRWGITKDEHAEAERARLAADRTYGDVDAGIAAWVDLLTVPDVDEDEDADPVAGTVIVRGKNSAIQVLTRAQLHRWADVGKRISVAVLPGFMPSDRAARVLAGFLTLRGALSWVRLSARELLDPETRLAWEPPPPPVHLDGRAPAPPIPPGPPPTRRGRTG